MSRRTNLPVEPPAGWDSIPMRVLVRRRDEAGRPDLPLLSVYRDLGVVKREGRDDNFNKPGMNLAAYRVVYPGDLVMNKMKTWQGSLGVSQYHGIVSPAYFVCEVSDSVDKGFLHYLLRSRPYVAEYAARSKGIRPAQWDLPWDEFRTIYVVAPPRDRQQRIADFLDRETARIEAVVRQRQDMAGLVWERSLALVDQLTANGQPARVKHLTTLITSGPRGWSEHVSDEGQPFIRSANLKDGSIRLDLTDLAYVKPPRGAEATRSTARTGDVCVGITGANTGWIGLVEDPPGSGFVSQHIALVRPSRCSAEWLAFSLASGKVQGQFGALQYGGTKQLLGLDDIAEIEISLPSPHEERSLVAKLLEAESRTSHLLHDIHRQVALLRETKNALITTAVAGEIDLSGEMDQLSEVLARITEA